MYVAHQTEAVTATEVLNTHTSQPQPGAVLPRSRHACFDNVHHGTSAPLVAGDSDADARVTLPSHAQEVPHTHEAHRDDHVTSGEAVEAELSPSGGSSVRRDPAGTASGKRDRWSSISVHARHDTSPARARAVALSQPPSFSFPALTLLSLRPPPHLLRVP